MILNRDQLIKDIKEFVGKDGYVPFEHGYQPTVNAYAVDYDGIWLKTTHKHRPFEEMCTEGIANIVFELFRYMNYCHLHA